MPAHHRTRERLTGATQDFGNTYSTASAGRSYCLLTGLGALREGVLHCLLADDMGDDRAPSGGLLGCAHCPNWKLREWRLCSGSHTKKNWLNFVPASPWGRLIMAPLYVLRNVAGRDMVGRHPLLRSNGVGVFGQGYSSSTASYVRDL